MMKLDSPRKLSSFVATRLDEQRAASLWNAVSRRAPSRARSRWRLPVVAFAAVVVAAAFFISRRTDVERRPRMVEYDKSGSMTLADGSHVRLRGDAHVRLEHIDQHDVELTLESGTAEFEVVHTPGRPFVVHAGRFDVADVGTRFVVTLDASRSLSVSVEDGRVEVSDVTRELPVRTLAAGESWTSVIATSPQPTESAPTTASVVPSTTPPRPANAKELFEAADAARVAGRPRDAAALLDALRHRHRNDARAGLAAFQLGRLRLDSLDDAAGAVEAFDDAISLAPTAPFREDAEARRVEALDRARDPRCREARETYLTRYPNNIRVKEVSARCAH